MNKVILMGRLTSDPKMDWTRSEDSKQYATYTLAVNRRFKKEWTSRYRFYLLYRMGSHGRVCRKIYEKRCYVRC